MTLLDDRPGRISRRPASVFADAKEFAERMLATLVPGPATSVAATLFADVTGIYRRVLEDRRGVLATQRSRVRLAGQAFAAAGGSPDTVVDMLGRLASQVVSAVAVQRPESVVPVVDVAHLVVRDFLTGTADPAGTARTATEPRWQLVQQLVTDKEIPQEIANTLDDGYVVAVLRFPDRIPQEWLMAGVEKHTAEGILSAPVDNGAIILVPERAGDFLDRLVEECEAVFGATPWLSATGIRPLAEIAAGYQEAKDVMALAVATRQRPGRYRLDDFLVEYAIVSDPVVSARLMSVLEPLLANEVLHETLDVLVRNDFHRAAAAQDLFVHRTTLDYRIRRIEEITGHSPMSSRGAHILRMAMTAHAMAGAKKH